MTPSTQLQTSASPQIRQRSILGLALLLVLAAVLAFATFPAIAEEGVDRAERRAQMAAAMLVRGADADRDGTVTATEWAEQLAAFDADADGVVTDDEAKAVREARREARREAHAAEGFDGPRGPRGRSGGLRGPGAGPDGESRFARAFDSDDDGLVTTTELQAAYDGLDADADGSISAEEMPVVRGPKHRRHHRKARAARLLHFADADDDGTLTRSEWSAFLASADTNADGSIDGDEMRALAEANRPADHEPRSVEIEQLEGLFDRVDADGDGAVTAEELPRRGRRGGPSLDS